MRPLRTSPTHRSSGHRLAADICEDCHSGPVKTCSICGKVRPCFDQPGRRPGTELEEGSLLRRSGFRGAVVLLVLPWRVVGVVQDRGARLAAAVAGGLMGRAVLADRGDYQLVAVETGPDPVVDQLVRNGVTHPFDGDRGVPVHPPRGAEPR